ncbi:MAG: hypothetical protein R2731_15935 [Nocardioides sp.]
MDLGTALVSGALAGSVTMLVAWWERGARQREFDLAHDRFAVERNPARYAAEQASRYLARVYDHDMLAERDSPEERILRSALMAAERVGAKDLVDALNGMYACTQFVREFRQMDSVSLERDPLCAGSMKKEPRRLLT